MQIKPRVRVKMGRQRLNADGLKMWDTGEWQFPYIAEWRALDWKPGYWKAFQRIDDARKTMNAGALVDIDAI